MNKANEDFSELDALLDKNLDDVADLPEYPDYVPNGMYLLHIKKIEKKKLEKEVEEGGEKRKIYRPVVQFSFELLEAMELNDGSEADKVPKSGSIIQETVWFDKDPELAASVLKAKFQEVGTALGIANIGELIPRLEGMKVGAIVKSRKRKDDPEKHNIQVSGCKVV